MFIELTDHLRCPADHEEAYLVLLPDRMVGRDVVTGHLGCPVCGWSAPVVEGVLDLGGGEAATDRFTLEADAVHALLGLSGPGGFVALLGSASAIAEDLTERLPGVALVAVNPPAHLPAVGLAGLIRTGRLPLKTACLRGIVVSAGPAAEPHWLPAAARAVLPGLRLVVEGPVRDVEGVEVLGSSSGGWVGLKVEGRRSKVE